MKKRTHKLLSLLLTLVMVLGMLPAMSITAFADYADGMDCLACGHYHWDQNVCGMCGLCSPECSSNCWEEFHCQYGCGACYLEIDYWCPDCGLCEDCMEDTDFHCKECRACLQPEDICQVCGKCENCVGWLCMDCGQCDDCSDDFHCEECGGCYAVNGYVHGTHCADCCEFCEQCGGCIIQNETEFCYECGLCEACCEDNRADSDCSCGDYCVESVEFEEHFCEFCGNCFDDVDQCEQCYLCADCCADNSDCSDGMCVEDPDYEEHFCEDCGTCFCEADPCETCCDEGELRCVFCCESLASSYGCDCGDVCVNDPDFEEHLETIHSGDGEIGPHSAKPQIGWSMNDTGHWHGCRLCGEDAHITGKANHTYDKYGVCTVCGFKQGAPVFITHQPKDVYAKVTDINAGESDPLHWLNNKVSFKVSAYGEGELTYQWYRVADGGTPVKLLTSNPLSANYGEGATTDKVTVSVPGDACTTVYTYYCVVKDEDGHTATSNAARIKAGHVYSRCQNVATGGPLPLYIKSGDSFDYQPYYRSDGHYWSCCGEEDFGDGETNFGNTRTKAPVSHNYANQEPIEATTSSAKAEAGTFDTYYHYTCADCGHQIYVQKHIHDFKCPVPGTEENNAYLAAHCTALTHPLVCTVAGCTETRTEQHEWQWRIADYPTAERPGGMLRDCQYCEYRQNKAWTDASGNPVQWTTANMLVSATYGTANRSLAAPGDKVTLTPKQTAGKKCTGWKADYTYYSGETRVTKTVSVTVTKNDDGTWTCIVPTFAAMDVNGGGQLGFEAQFADCACNGDTKVVGAREAVCTRSGYTGDTVCADCGKILEVGDPIPGGTEHEGTLSLVLGTEVEATCTQRGYTGDFKCDACGGIVAGERTGYAHGDEDNYYLRDYVNPTCTTEGYTGDKYCNTCDKLLAHGKVLPIQHSTRTLTHNAAYASCTDSGYTGDTQCSECGQFFKMGKTIYPFGHDWDDGVLLKEATVTERGEMLYTCTNQHYVAGEGFVDCGETKIEYIPRLSDTTVDVTAAEVSVTAPVKGKTPANATASGGQFTVANTAWEPVPGSTFAADTVYSVVVTLEANEGYRFTSATAFKVNGSAAAIVTRSTQEAKISFTFPATASSGSSGSGSGGSSSGGGSGVSTYAITVASAKHGSVTASDKTAAKGDTVTLTVKPDKDYALDTLTVTDKNGDELKLKEKNGKYTFTMPASKVTVKAAFAAVKAEQPEQPVAVNPFTDVAEGAYYYDAVQWAVGQGITKGTTDTTFSPGNTCTRAQIITFLWRANGSPEPKGACTFTDVPAGSYFEKAVAWAAEQGMASGDKFAPYDPCTRLMAVEFMWKQAGSPTAPAAAFTDVSSDAVNWALEKGVTKGTTETTFSPGNTCTRAQIVTFLWRAFAE